ncbi:ABC transporter [Pelomyxa schiedti]|nr:ABC transporter [Pelomyxa schiedti]
MATDNTRLLDAESQATNCTYKKITTQVIAVDNSLDSEGFHCGEVPVLSSCVTTSTCGGYQILRECEEQPANVAGGVSVSFRNVRYTIETAERKESNGGMLDSAMSQLSMCRRKRTETILHGVSGHVPAGKLLAIMGPSGSGKTTLVDILALRPKTGKATGYVAWQVLQTPPSVQILQSMQTATSTLDMVRYTPVESHNLAAYVMQDDVFLGNLTVRETLRYSLRLKQKCESDTARENKLINTWISKMKLDKVADKPVGTPLKRGISGGERRRLSIA